MLKYIMLLCLAVSVHAQSANTILSQLGASGVTAKGGTNAYANYIVKLNAQGKLDAGMVTVAGSSALNVALNGVRFVDSVNGSDSTNASGSAIAPYQSIAYALTNGSPVHPVLLLAPGAYATTTIDNGAYPGLTNLTIAGIAPGVIISNLTLRGASGSYDAAVTLQNLQVSGRLYQQDNRTLDVALREHTRVSEIRIASTNALVTLDTTASVDAYTVQYAGVFTVALAAPATHVSHGTNTVAEVLDTILVALTPLASTNWVIAYAYPVGNPSNFVSTNQLGYLTNLFVGTNWVTGYAYPLTANPSNYVNATITNGFADTGYVGRVAYPLTGNPSNFVTVAQWATSTGAPPATTRQGTYMMYETGTGVLYDVYITGLVVSGAANNLDGNYTYLAPYYIQDGLAQGFVREAWQLVDGGTIAYTNNALGLMIGVNGYPGACTTTVTYATNVLPLASLAQVGSMLQALTNGYTGIVYSNPAVFYPMSNPYKYLTNVVVTTTSAVWRTKDVLVPGGLTNTIIYLGPL